MPVLDIPDFESALLWDIAIAVARRGKAIRYHGGVKCSRVVEKCERLDLDFTGISGFRVRLSVWSDTVIWLSITKPGPRRTGGWSYSDQFHSCLEDLSARDVAERYEQTIHSPMEARRFWPEFSNETRST